MYFLSTAESEELRIVTTPNLPTPRWESVSDPHGRSRSTEEVRRFASLLEEGTLNVRKRLPSEQVRGARANM